MSMDDYTERLIKIYGYTLDGLIQTLIDNNEIENLKKVKDDLKKTLVAIDVLIDCAEATGIEMKICMNALSKAIDIENMKYESKKKSQSGENEE